MNTLMKVLVVSLLVVSAQAIPACRPDTCFTVLCAAVTADSCDGTVVKHGGFCGCCDSCVKILAQGESCAQTMLLGAPTTAQCDQGLLCHPTQLTCQDAATVEKQLAAGS
ncbi:hypothetical protein BaRGS_00031755 [Batillaria attramentaria]|uniref:Uncharacterized protein n=1 Tax=Batillaria attramentaria TaxID=370345 RepID=A0ABD0JQF3_9CAEN